MVSTRMLDCYHGFENTFDVFAIKTCKSNGQTVGHLPRKISRVTKFLLDRGIVAQATLSTTHYRRSPLVQGGLEIACKVSVKMPGTIKNHLLMDRYFELVDHSIQSLKMKLFWYRFCVQWMYHAHQKAMLERKK